MGVSPMDLIAWKLSPLRGCLAGIAVKTVRLYFFEREMVSTPSQGKKRLIPASTFAS
jgi:hypothetical protein